MDYKEELEKFPEKINPYELICKYAFSMDLNANDFFGYATAHGVSIDADDLDWIIPVLEKWQHDGMNAVMSFIEEAPPIKPYRTKEFREAIKYLEKLNPKIHSRDLI